jgi:capsular polysaccharide export protein
MFFSAITHKKNIYALNFSPWKRPVVQKMFADAKITFIRTVNNIPNDCTLIVWGYKNNLTQLSTTINVVRVEDGFLRSVGLGADLIRPVSWVADSRGLYYDATRVSDLECILANENFSAEILQRAQALQQSIIALGLTKYNLPAAPWCRPLHAERVILVAGQVESDASLAFGAPHIKTNLALLQAVREANASAYIIYKPHPDVVAKLRSSGKNEHEAIKFCNELLPNAAMHELLMAVDEVHVLTSLTGFEALLRGKLVVCYGQPFYAGWGLTCDMLPITRRKRCLLLPELVAGALIMYPTYFSKKTEQLISVEQAMDELSQWQARNVAPQWWRALKRIALRHIVGVK